MSSPFFVHRPFRGPADLQAMLALVGERPPQWITEYPFIVDLQEITGTPEGQASIRLWEDTSGSPVGFSLLDGTSLAFEISPRVPFDDLAGQIIHWAMQKLTSAGESPASPAELVVAGREEDLRRMAFLERQGFVAQPVRTLRFMRSLEEPLPEPALPEGFLIRPMAGEEEAGAWVALHRAALGTENMTVDFRLAMMRTPEYDRELDLVAVVPDGRLVAYVMCHFSSEENRLRQQTVGYTDPVATHPDFQRKGLSRALLLAGFGRLKQRGMQFAEVATWGENTAMIKTAESAGYRVYSSSIFFSRDIS
jgi:ribosomal protein S18 acetylase RimI-like enzyme